jgi:hypothetical protein
MISEGLGLFELPNPSDTLESGSLIISEALGLFGMATPCVTRERSSLMISEALGLFGCRIHASPVTGVLRP